MLVINPQPFVGESWPGYLLRLAEKNHYRGIAGLAKLLELKQAKLILANPGEILKQLKVNDQLIQFDNLEFTVRPRHRLSMHGRSMRSRICPRCIEDSENFYIPASWDQTFRLACEKHQITLIDRCLSCKQLISYRRTSLTQCECGFEFKKSPSKQIDFTINSFLSVCDLQAQYASPPSTFSKNTYEDTAAYLFCRRLLKLSGNLSKEEIRNCRNVEAFATVENMQLLVGWFDDWPRIFNKFLKIHFAISRNPRYEMLLGQQTRPGLTLQTVHSVVTNFLDVNRKSQRIYPITPYPKKSVAAQAITGNKEYVSLHFVMRTTGSNFYQAKFWMKKGWLGDVKTIQVSPNKIEYQVQKDAAQKAIQIIKSTSSRAEVCLALGLHSKAIRFIREAGFITGIPYGQSTKLFRLLPSEVFDFARLLLSKSTPNTKDTSKQTLFSSLVIDLGKNRPHLLKILLSEMLAGKFTLQTQVENAIDLSNLYLLRTELQAWRAEAMCRYADA
jgi:hypothetical protein